MKMMNGFVQDLRYAFRLLRKKPGFSAVTILTLALGIGATTAIFSAMYGVLLRPLPYADPSRIVALFEVNTHGDWSRLADPNFDDFRDQSRSFQALAKYSAYISSVSGASEPTRSVVARVSPDFLKIFRVQPIVGRDLTSSDGKQGAAPVALVSYGYWKQYLGSSHNLSQLHLKIDNAVFSVIGVLPQGFGFPDKTALWVPADLDGENPSRTSHNYSAVARLRDSVTIEQANAEIGTIARRIHDRSSEQNEYLLTDAAVVPLQESITGQSRLTLLLLLGAVSFLLLVACANVANLRLAQASVRERELALRSALGAARGRLIRQSITESFLLSLIAGSVGVIAAYAGVNALVALAPQNLPRVNEISINLPVFIFAFLLSCLVATGLGVFIAMRATSSGDVRAALAQGSHQHAGSQASQRLGRAIVAAQIAITLVLVVGAGLLGRSLLKVLEVNPGFRVEKIITMDVSLAWAEGTDLKAKAAQAIFFRSLIDRLKQIPGVRRVGATNGLPLDGGLPDGMFLLMTQDEAPKQSADVQSLARRFDELFRQKQRLGNADFGVATAGYFQSLGIPLLKGRMFDERDGFDSPHVAVISASLARERWPGQDPIGHTIEFGNMDGDMRLLTIVGIVGDVHEYGLDLPPRPTVYVDLFQRPRPDVSITLLSDSDTQSVTSAAREIVRELNPEMPVRFRTFAQIYAASLGSRRFNLLLIGFFAVAATLLAMAGVFGVTAYSVTRRTSEIGVRMALGATPAGVLRLVVGQAMLVIAAGVMAGLLGAFALTRAMSALLFGLTATDPATFTAVVLFLALVALFACYIPARRAAKVDPMVALRYE